MRERPGLRIFQTRRWPEPAERALDDLGEVWRPSPDGQLDARQLRGGLQWCDIFCPTVSDRIDAQILCGDDLRPRLIANYGAGVSHIDMTLASARGHMVTNTPDVLTESTADVAMLLILAVARRAGEGERQLRARRWPGWHPTHLMGTGVTGRSLGLIGFGRIAQALARKARLGFGMSIFVANRSRIPVPLLAETGAVQVATIDDLISSCDFISIHVPGGGATRHLFDARRIAMMKRDAFLINTARGEIVDESALADALRNNVIAGAGLDVFETEPRVEPALLECENAVLLPHLGSATLDTRVAMGLRVVDNIRDWVAGRPPRDLVQ